MLWNCPHCQHAITNRTIKSVKVASENNRRAMQCPACQGEVEMNVHSSEYWQIIIPVLGLLALWGASKNSNSTASMVLAAIMVGGGLAATLYIKNVLLKRWQRFRVPAKPE
jgi:hypothetical protein